MRIQPSFMFILFLCFPLISWASDQNDPLNLVVGSTRQKGHVSPYIQILYGDKTDFTHLKTFNGRATTLDLKEGAIENVPHFIADARTFEAKERIDRIFIELFPSVDLSPSTNNVDSILCMPHMLQNLASQMKPGGILEIEHIPHLTMMDFKSYCELEQGIVKLNPFTGVLFPFFMEEIGYSYLQRRTDKPMVEKMKFWQSIVDKYSSSDAPVDAVALALQGPIRYVKVLEAILSLEELINPMCPPELSVQKILNMEYLEYISNQTIFMSRKFKDSLSGFVATEMTMLTQQENMRKYLEERGFRDVKIQRRDNPHNGRRNVWFISAIRK